MCKSWRGTQNPSDCQEENVTRSQIMWSI